MIKQGLLEFWAFGLKQAWACLFGGYLLALMLVSQYWYPFTTLHRYDFLFLAALAFQGLLLALKLESPREALVILVFHLVATVMELFKTMDGINAWAYPGQAALKLGNVPLFAGFMYSAVGSYIARVWRLFDFRFSHYPRRRWTLLLALLAYLNFFGHHYFWDLRWLLLGAVAALFWRVDIYFKVKTEHRRMPLLLGWLLVALFIWFAENIATYCKVWLYPNQVDGWQMVGIGKLGAWYLLMMLSFVLVSLIHRPQAPAKVKAALLSRLCGRFLPAGRRRP
ncbi:DUF817 domain-containing protein [Gallaecimonas pentaromativorans]|uniref:DUF817 domain-containing protein n=1 Tax=Gallaecimonas pentaromativorans TaxID=584787 RepID=UPI00067EA0D7|nr:DUF817 domain-containing protein [Gallaecimonas pentaromativorans]